MTIGNIISGLGSGGIGNLISGGLSLFGALSEGRRAQQAYGQQDQALQAQSANLAFQQDLLSREFDALEDERAYFRQQDGLNRQLAEQERRQAFDMYFMNNERLQQERDYFVQRQEFIDKQASQERADQLGFMLQNQMIAAEERDFALAELARAQQIAQGERDEELRIFYDNQFRAEAERQYGIDQFERAQGIAKSEREQEAAFRDALDSQIVSFQDELRRVQEGLGDIRRLDPLTQEYIDSQVGRYRDTAKDSYDEVIEQMASLNEADLRRRGIAATDPGDTRSRMAQRLADDLAAAQLQAEQQALAYISGERGLLFDDIQQDIATRNAILGETAQVGLAGYDQRRNLMNTLPSANVAAPVPIGTSVIQQRFGTANVNAPVPIGTSQFAGSLPSGIGAQLNMPSAVQSGFNPPSAMVRPSASSNLGGSLLGSLSSGYNNMATNYGGRGDAASARSSMSFDSVGEALENIFAAREGNNNSSSSTVGPYGIGQVVPVSNGQPLGYSYGYQG